MFEETGPQKVKEWEETERQMMMAYNDPRRDAIVPVDDDDAFDDMDGYVEFEIASTGYVFQPPLTPRVAAHIAPAEPS